MSEVLAKPADVLTKQVRDDPALLDVEQVAGLLNCSPRHVYRLSDAGRMPTPVRLGALASWAACGCGYPAPATAPSQTPPLPHLPSSLGLEPPAAFQGGCPGAGGKKANKDAPPREVSVGGQNGFAGQGARDMANAQAAPVIRFLRHLAAVHGAADRPDGQLLHRFASQGDEGAFAALVRRHGPMVLAVCRRVLNDTHAAEDCFQATFLTLARKAGSLRQPESLGPWLYGVACRTALKAKEQAARRRASERLAAVTGSRQAPDEFAASDLRHALDEAIVALPEKYRTPVVLHCLQGLTLAEVARQLACPAGTVATRLARAREQLRARLTRRGLMLSAGTFAALCH